MYVDHPKVRRSHTCVACGGPKDQNLLLCWPCHRREKRQNDYSYSEYIEHKLNAAEEEL